MKMSRLETVFCRTNRKLALPVPSALILCQTNLRGALPKHSSKRTLNSVRGSGEVDLDGGPRKIHDLASCLGPLLADIKQRGPRRSRGGAEGIL